MNPQKNIIEVIFMQLPIKACRLYIDVFNERMAESMYINSLDGDNRRFVPDEVFETIGAARETLAWLISLYENSKAPQVYPIFLNDGRHIGHVQAVPIDDRWEIGYHVAEPFTGNGYATEAVGAFLPPIMRRLGISRIYGICHIENAASRRVLEKCGFTIEYEGIAHNMGANYHICRYIRFCECDN